MADGAAYNVKVRATYKDFQPIDFEMLVKYLPNLDGKTKFVDLGTHVFYRNATQRPVTPYTFVLQNVVDAQDDDLDVYQMKLSDGLHNYYSLDNQENEIKISSLDS
jgi:hypothetical protein